MASDGDVSCIGDPNFAVICSFLEVFGQLCPFEIPDILQLQQLLENTEEVKESLRELHVKLLRRVIKTVPFERWERCLIKFCHMQGYRQDAWELERFGYKKSSLKIKLKILKALLEHQFTCNPKFKNKVNELEIASLRLEPVGHDRRGRAYWLHVDASANLRLYREDNEEETWHVIANDRESLVKVINQLKTGSDEDDIKDLTINEDSSSEDEAAAEECREEINESQEDPVEKIEVDVDLKCAKDENQEVEEPKKEETDDDSNEEFLSPESEPESEDDSSNKSEKNIALSPKSIIKTISKNIIYDKNSSNKESQLNQKESVLSEDVKEELEVSKEIKESNQQDCEKSIELNTDVKSNLNETKLEKQEVSNEPNKKELFDNHIESDRNSSENIDIQSNDLECKPDDDNLADGVGEAIEEPVMHIKGDGNGADCESIPFIIGEEICEPVMYIWGLGEGYECQTGNSAAMKGGKHENDESCNNTEEPTKKKRGKATKNTSPPIVRNANSLRKKPSDVNPIPVSKRNLKAQSEPEKIVQIERKKTRMSESKKAEDGLIQHTDALKHSGVDSNHDDTDKSVNNESVLDRKHLNSVSNTSESEVNTIKKKVVRRGKKMNKKNLKVANASVSSDDNTEKSFSDTKTHGKHKSEKEVSEPKEIKVETLPSKKLRLDSTTDEPEVDKSTEVKQGKGRKKKGKAAEVNNDQTQLDTSTETQKKSTRISNMNEMSKSSEQGSSKPSKDIQPVSKESLNPENTNEKTPRKAFKGRKKQIEKAPQTDSDSDVNLNAVATKTKNKNAAVTGNLKEKRKRARDKSASLSESENEELQTNKRIKIKPKRILKAARRKVENKLKQQKDSSEESESKEVLKPKKGGKANTNSSVTPKTPKTKKSEIDKLLESAESTPLSSVRQSRRLAQLKIREEAERRQLEEDTLRKLKVLHKKKSKKDSDASDWEASAANSQEEEKVSKRKKRNKNTSAEESSESEDPLIEHEHHEPDLQFDKSDHEFSPESEVENAEELPPVRRARTLKDEAIECDGCSVCGKDTLPEWILLCDSCDKGFHAACLKPILFLVPSGDWFCPECRHTRLIEALESKLDIYDQLVQLVATENERKTSEKALEKKEVEEPKEDSEDSYDSCSTESDGRVYRLRERRALPVSYRFKEYDQIMSTAIKEPIKEEDDAAAGNQGRGKDISTIIEAAEEEKKEEWKKNRSRKKPRKLNSLEVPSEDEDSDDDFKETGWSTSDSESASNSADASSSGSSDSDEVLARRSQRPSKSFRKKIIESPDFKKKKGYGSSSDEESSGTKDWKNKSTPKKKTTPKKRRQRRSELSKLTPHVRRHHELKQYDADGNVIKKRVEYGGLDSDGSHDWSPKHRTRQKKINYTEMPNTESEDEVHKPSGKHMPDSSDEFKLSESELSAPPSPVYQPLSLAQLVRNHLQKAEKTPVSTAKRKSGGNRSRGAARRGGRSNKLSIGPNITPKATTSSVSIPVPPEKTPAQEERERKKAEKEAAKAARAAERQAKIDEKQKAKEEREKARLEKQQAKIAALEQKKAQREKTQTKMLNIPIQIRPPVSVPSQSPQPGPANDSPRPMGQNVRPGVGPQPRAPRGPRPRLQVRPELRGMRPDSALLRPRGTLSVAGAPQPFQPAHEQPSIITRMPHHPQLRAPGSFEQTNFRNYPPQPGGSAPSRPYYYPPPGNYPQNYQQRMPPHGQGQQGHPGPPGQHEMPMRHGPPGQIRHPQHVPTTAQQGQSHYGPPHPSPQQNLSNHQLPNQHLPPGGYLQHMQAMAQRQPHPHHPSLANQLQRPPMGHLQPNGRHPHSNGPQPPQNGQHQPTPPTEQTSHNSSEGRLQRPAPSSHSNRSSPNNQLQHGGAPPHHMPPSSIPQHMSHPGHPPSPGQVAPLRRFPPPGHIPHGAYSTSHNQLRHPPPHSGSPLPLQQQGSPSSLQQQSGSVSPVPEIKREPQEEEQREPTRPKVKRTTTPARHPLGPYAPQMSAYGFRGPPNRYLPPFQGPPDRFSNPHHMMHERYPPPSSNTNYHLPERYRPPMHPFLSERYPPQGMVHNHPERFPPPTSDHFVPSPARSTPPERHPTPNPSEPEKPRIQSPQERLTSPPNSSEHIPPTNNTSNPVANNPIDEAVPLSGAPPPPIKRYMKAHEAATAAAAPTDLSKSAVEQPEVCQDVKEPTPVVEEPKNSPKVPDLATSTSKESTEAKPVPDKIVFNSKNDSASDLSRNAHDLSMTKQTVSIIEPKLEESPIEIVQKVELTAHSVVAINSSCPEPVINNSGSETDGSQGAYEDKLEPKKATSPQREFTGLVSYFSSQHDDTDS